MPALHSSVTYCDRCDHIVAVIEIEPCAQCNEPICPACALPTNDKDLRVCSHRCQALVNRDIQEAA